MAKPFLRWVGGKRALVQKITSYFPGKCEGSYFEPFLGGGAVFFALEEAGKIAKSVLTDRLEPLINAYDAVQNTTELLLQELKNYESHHDPEDSTFYYDIRKLAPDGTLYKAAQFIYLNRTCFNGLYRENKSGKFNVPVGYIKNPIICDVEGLQAVTLALRHAYLRHCDFRDILDEPEDGDWVYLDPPYHTGGSNFTDYTARGFGDEEQKDLADLFHDMVRRGVHVVASNVDSTFIRRIYRGPNVYFYEVLGPRRVAASAKARLPAREVIIVGSSGTAKK